MAWRCGASWSPVEALMSAWASSPRGVLPCAAILAANVYGVISCI